MPEPVYHKESDPSSVWPSINYIDSPQDDSEALRIGQPGFFKRSNSPRDQ